MELFSVGDTDTIDSVTATYEFRGYEDPIDLEECLFLTSDSKVATVKEVNGVVTVTAVAKGTADILVSYKDEAKAVAIDTVAVTVSAILLTSIVVSPDEITIPEGGPTGNIGTIIACYNDGSVDSIDLDDEGCDYQSSNEKVATVKDGVITKVVEGLTIITVSYTEGGITGKDIVLVMVEFSGVATLSNLELNVGTFVETFASDTFVYTVTDIAAACDIIVTPTATDADKGATIMVNVNPVVSGDPSPAMGIAAGENIINIFVTAEDGSTETYKITITIPPG
ncbi:hypothetical protein ES705_50038 [subsurface metagenome]